MRSEEMTFWLDGRLTLRGSARLRYGVLAPAGFRGVGVKMPSR